MSRTASHLVLAALVLVGAGFGCSGDFDYGPTGKITGKLTMDGKPLSAGTGVQFMEPIKGFLAYGETKDDGSFDVVSFNGGQMPLGKYKVYITPPPGKPVDPATVSAEDRFDNPELVDPQVRLEFPKKYADMAKSGLEYEIKEGDNHFEINLDGLKKK